MTPAEHVALLNRRPQRTAVMTDFDGTLASIVADPEGARPLAGAVEVLTALASRFRVVGVISGRPAAFLMEHFCVVPGIVLSGLYGMEHVHGSQIDVHPRAKPYVDAVEAVAMRADREAPNGVLVERKGLTVTVHYRTNPDARPWVEAFVADEAKRSGLAIHPGRQALELRPPIGADKGTTVEQWANGMEAACFLGDDIGDLPAFDALDRLAERGTHSVRVVASSAEVPPPLLARADVVVDGPEGALEFLRQLCG